jgi:prepilin-type N-terminal cleavage/methylation domain-containing protein
MRKQIYRQISNFLANKKLVRGFTITELLVAVGLLAVVLSASTMVFHYSIEAQRTAMATSEIMHSLRAITDQLNADFAGLRKDDAPMIMEFHGTPADSNKADSIVFFTTGDFQTIDGTVRGNVARIYYGQAGLPPDTNVVDPNKILVRKQVILEPNQTSSTNEYEPNSLSQLMNIYLNPAATVNTADRWLRRCDINDRNSSDIAMYLAKDVNDFSIEFCNAGDISAGGAINWRPPNNQRRYFGYGLSPQPYPDLIKFTFTLYDSRKILKTGRTFEHIVYIGN